MYYQNVKNYWIFSHVIFCFSKLSAWGPEKANVAIIAIKQLSKAYFWHLGSQRDTFSNFRMQCNSFFVLEGNKFENLTFSKLPMSSKFLTWNALTDKVQNVYTHHSKKDGWAKYIPNSDSNILRGYYETRLEMLYRCLCKDHLFVQNRHKFWIWKRPRHTMEKV